MFCSKCGKELDQVDNSCKNCKDASSIKKQNKSPLLLIVCFFGPIIGIFISVSFWGIFSVILETSSTESEIYNIINALIPIIIGLLILLIPVGIVLGVLVILNRK